MLYVVCINLHKVSYKSNLHCWAWWCFINQRHILLEFDNFWIVDLGVRNHSDKKWSFELQSFAIFGFQSLDHILSFFLKIFLIENFGFLTFSFFALNWKKYLNSGIPQLKVEKILKRSLDSIPSPSPAVKIQIMSRKVCWEVKAKHC